MASKIKVLPPAAELHDDDYVPEVFDAPAISGKPFKLFVRFMESSLFGIVRGKLLRDNGFTQLFGETFIPEMPTFLPNTRGWRPEQGPLVELEPELSDVERAGAAFKLTFGEDPATDQGPWRQHTCADYRRAYASGQSTPSQVAERVITAVAASEELDPAMCLFTEFDPDKVRAAAAASTERWRNGSPLSPLDGVPFGVKDLVDVLGYKTTAGTSWMADWRRVEATNPAVAALLSAGALLLGKLATHEIGLGTTGLNTVLGTPRNPHDPGRHTGGSSSGSAAAVAAGLCPLALGSDGGGSVRIPAALCGCVGLKPTHDRLDHSQGPEVDCTVAVLGPLAASVADCQLAYAVMAGARGPGSCAGPHGSDPGPTTPPVRLSAGLPRAGQDLSGALAGKQAGIYWKWFEDASPEVLAACRAAVEKLRGAGLEVVDIVIPELRHQRLAHSVTICSEMRSAMSGPLSVPAVRCQLDGETRASLTNAVGFTGAFYVNAQRVRTRSEAHFRRAFAACDLILTPTTPAAAPRCKPGALAAGETDLATTLGLMRFITPANFLGFPALTLPVGVDAAGLPLGLQLMAPPWHEAGLLHAGAVLEAALGGGVVPRPRVWYDLLRD
ncbi:hypothetical protein ACKKBG_A35910 [Auxenochlorella protothecoides x Auxenochlorella symbiontica]